MEGFLLVCYRAQQKARGISRLSAGCLLPLFGPPLRMRIALSLIKHGLTVAMQVHVPVTVQAHPCVEPSMEGFVSG
jgi:hypothetical protein